MESQRKCLKIKVHGKVQGVWFRASTKQKADELRVTGFVRNETDGSVYIEAEGTEKQLRDFLEWCHEGPIYAKVSTVEQEFTELQDFESFKILK